MDQDNNLVDLAVLIRVREEPTWGLPPAKPALAILRHSKLWGNLAFSHK
jgi:hypothetical protein